MPDADAATTVRIPAGDVTLAADVHGAESDPPVLLFHGGGQTRHAWGGTAAALAARGFRAVSVDLRGHGDSDWSPDGIYDIGRFAADVRAAAATFDTPPTLVGASLGGIASMVAIAEAPAGPEVASALVLVDVAHRVEADGVAKIGAFMTAHLDGFDTLDDVADAIAAYTPHRPRPKDLSGLTKNVRQRPDGRWVWHWDPRFVRVTEPVDEPRGYTPEGRLREAAASLTLPTLLVRGRMSDVLSEAGARELQEIVPHARYVDVDGAGHMVAGDRNDVFTDAVVDFLTSGR